MKGRIEEHYGRRIVCGHIFPEEEIKVGSRWQDSGGRVIKILEVKNGWVRYKAKNEPERDRDFCSFQGHYCLIV